MKASKLRTALLISGGGSTAEAVIKAAKEGGLRGIDPVVVIASRHGIAGEQKALALGIPTFVVERREFKNADAFGEKLLEILKKFEVDLVSQNGWLVKTPTNVIEALEGKIINQHPGPLDPGRADFGGKEMYGRRVMCARLAYEWAKGADKSWTEATTHWVTEEYDEGELIRLVRMEVDSLNGPVTIADLRALPSGLIEATNKMQSRLLPLEHENVIATLQQLAEGKLPRFERSEPLVPDKYTDLIDQAKMLAISLFPKG